MRFEVGFSFDSDARETNMAQQLSQDQLLRFKTTLRERSDALRADIRNTLERSADETHVRVAEQARDMEDDSPDEPGPGDR